MAQEFLIRGEKIWDDADNQDGKRPDSIKVYIKLDDKKIAEIELNDKNNWKFILYGFDKNGKPVFDDKTKVETPLYEYNNGKKIKYSVEEDKVKDYNLKIEEIEVEEEKSNIYKNRKDYTGAAVNSDNELDNDKIEEIDKSDSKKTQTIIVREFSLTNKHQPELISISVTKLWDDNNNQDGIRLSAEDLKSKLHLISNGKEEIKDEPTVVDNGDGTYTYTWTNLPKYSDGKEIQYTITEETIKDYTTTITGDVSSGFTITNTHTPELPPKEEPKSPVPDTSTKYTPPKTGDNTNIGLWISLLTISTLLSFSLLFFLRRQRKA